MTQFKIGDMGLFEAQDDLFDGLAAQVLYASDNYLEVRLLEYSRFIGPHTKHATKPYTGQRMSVVDGSFRLMSSLERLAKLL